MTGRFASVYGCYGILHRWTWSAFYITASLVRETFNFNPSVGLWGMDRQITIRRLLAIFMIAGLVLAPVARPAMVGSLSDVSMAAMTDDGSVPATADAMTGDMPCCPSNAPTPVGCDKCIFMAACAANCFAGLTAALFQPPFAVSSGLSRPQNDFRPDRLGDTPPEHPPRTLV
jgi:hypothetical protein